MAASVRPLLIGGERSWTVTDTAGLPIVPAERYLAFLRSDDRSPNTVRSYARGLAEWWTVLEASGVAWDGLTRTVFGDFLAYLRTGDLPGVDRIGPVPQRLAPASVANRAAAVLAFYTWAAAALNITQPRQMLYQRSTRRHHSYLPMLTGVVPATDRPAPVFRLRVPNKSRTPLLTPGQVRTILDGCAIQDPAGDGWRPNLAGLRDRFLFALLAESGMRLGEALSLRHCDIHIGAGGTPWVEVVPRQDHPHGVRNKSSRGRDIYIGADLEGLYSAYVWELIDAGIDVQVADVANHFVFVNVGGQPLFAPMRAKSVYARVRALTRDHRAALPPDWTPHWLRHTHATALLLAGRPVHVVMRRLGHLDVQTTLSTYGWVTEDAEMRALANWKSYVAGWKGIHDDQPA